MLEWLQNNANVVSSLGTIATLLVWIIWLQLMYNDYRSRRQPRMLIHQTHGLGPQSHCMLVNLSEDIIHVLCVQATAVDEDEEEFSLVLGSEALNPGEMGDAELENVIRQGPLSRGELMQLGSFEEILEALTETEPPQGSDWLDGEAATGISRVEIRVVAVFGDSDHSIGARRTFELEALDTELKVRPVDLYTEQLYSRRKRRITEQWLRRCLQE